MWAYYQKRGKDLDPRDRSLWIFHRAHDGSPPWREFKPLTWFQKKRKEGKV